MKKIKIVSLVLAVVLLAGVSGCKKDKKEHGGKSHTCQSWHSILAILRNCRTFTKHSPEEESMASL